MEHARMQSLITKLVQNVERGDHVGPEQAVLTVMHGLQEFVSEYEADLADAYDRDREPTTLAEMHLWKHMYAVLDKAGLKLLTPPRRAKKRGAPKGKPAALADVRKHAKAAREAMRRAMKGT